MSDLRSVIQDHWNALRAEVTHGGWLTSELPVAVNGRPLLCALGPDGNLHLLTPRSKNEHLSPDLKADAVQIVPLTLDSPTGPLDFADLRLMRPDLEDVFTALCADLVAEMAISSAGTLIILSQVVEAWRELFRSGTRLSVAQLAGLFGELLVLEQLLALRNDMLKSWLGPLKMPQDFHVGPWAIEVKATASSDGNTFRVHGIDQLATDPAGGLILWWMRLDASSAGGRSIPQLVENLRTLVDRPVDFLRLLARTGYYTGDTESYSSLKFTVSDQARYLVNDAFPRIVPDMFDDSLEGITDIRYTVDLASCPAPMTHEAVSAFLHKMVLLQ